MQKYRLITADVKALQLNWKNWHEMCGFMGKIISDHNPARNVETYHDKCGEEGPFIELVFSNQYMQATEGPDSVFVAKHGDWIIEEIEGSFYVVQPKIFDKIYALVPGPVPESEVEVDREPEVDREVSGCDRM